MKDSNNKLFCIENRMIKSNLNDCQIPIINYNPIMGEYVINKSQFDYIGGYSLEEQLLHYNFKMDKLFGGFGGYSSWRGLKQISPIYYDEFSMFNPDSPSNDVEYFFKASNKGIIIHHNVIVGIKIIIGISKDSNIILVGNPYSYSSYSGSIWLSVETDLSNEYIESN